MRSENINDTALDINNIFSWNLSGWSRYEKVIKLNLSNNKIQIINGDFCKSLPNVEFIDLRAHKIVEISPQIRLMVSIQIIKLDKNELTSLPDEIFDIKLIEELTFQ